MTDFYKVNLTLVKFGDLINFFATLFLNFRIVKEKTPKSNLRIWAATPTINNGIVL